MATCPNCGNSSRTDPTFVLQPMRDLIVRPDGVTVRRFRLTHAWCGWRVDGWLEGSGFVGVDATQVFPGQTPEPVPAKES